MLVPQTGFLLSQSKFHSHQQILSYMLREQLEQGMRYLSPPLHCSSWGQGHVHCVHWLWFLTIPQSWRSQKWPVQETLANASGILWQPQISWVPQEGFVGTWLDESTLAIQTWFQINLTFHFAWKVIGRPLEMSQEGLLYWLVPFRDFRPTGQTLISVEPVPGSGNPAAISEQ